MKILYQTTLSFLLLASLFAGRAAACTTFCLKSGDEVLFGKNYDWMIGDGLVFVNKRGVEKSAFTSGAEAPAAWVSKYGSVTFNQYGRDNPSGGMNEAGLVIELMWLDDTVYPAADARPALDVLEWIQYQLDVSADVAEVIRHAEGIRIASPVKLHYLVGDRQGNAATIEYLDGKLVAHTGANLAVAALANDTYEKSLNYSKTTAPDKARSESSLDRFTRAAQKTREFAAKPKTEAEEIAYAFGVLADVAQKKSTQWSIVYDQKRAKIHFRSMSNPAIRTVDAKAFDYACGTPVRIFDVNAGEKGDVTAKFADYTPAANRDLIERSFNGTPFLKMMPASMRDRMAEFADGFACEGVQGKYRLGVTTAETERAEHGFIYSALQILGKLLGLA
ncbi:MAG: linear amide C-N hydrolase [Acidobacteria bacterium]|nr:linear amide C-N hydrolase [Acidobacteriota bacterium]